MFNKAWGSARVNDAGGKKRENTGVLRIIASGRIICQVAGKVINSVIYGEWQVFILSGRK